MILFYSLLSSTIVMTLAWAIHTRVRNLSIVDCAWSLAILASSTSFYFFSPKHTAAFLVLFIIFLWSARLSCYIFLTRIKKGHLDKRYEAMRATSNSRTLYAYFSIFLLQASLAWAVSLCFYFVARATIHSHFFIIGFVIMWIGLLGEILSDWQLHIHKKQHRGTLCDSGLWAYSRHPNLFFDWLFWLGIAITALSVRHGWI